MDELYDQLMRELRNQRNWVSDTEQALANQRPASEDENKLKEQVNEQKVRERRNTHSSEMTDNLLYMYILNGL